MEAANGGNTLRPARLSLDARKSLNSKPVAKGVSAVPTKKPARKSLPRLPSEKTKLPPDSKDITASSKKTNEHESEAKQDLSQEQEQEVGEEKAEK